MVHSESYSLGYLQAIFDVNKSLTESQAQRAITLSNNLECSIDADMKNYIQTNFPQLIKNK